MANALVVKLEHRLVINQDVATARLMLQLFGFPRAAQVIAEEGVPRPSQSPSTSAWRINSSAQRRVDSAVVDLTRGDDRQAATVTFPSLSPRLRPLPVRLTKER